MHELFFLIALLVGISGAFIIWNYSRNKQNQLVNKLRKNRDKDKLD